MLKLTVHESRILFDIVRKKLPVNIFIGEFIDLVKKEPTEEIINYYEDFIKREEEEKQKLLKKQEEERLRAEKEIRLQKEKELENLSKLQKILVKKIEPVPFDLESDNKVLPKIISADDDEKTRQLKEKWNKYAIPSN